MKKKALGIIILYLSMILIIPMGKLVQETKNISLEDVQIVIDNSKTKSEYRDALNVVVETKSSANNELIYQTMDFTSPSYTNLSSSEDNPIIEGTEVTLTSQVTSQGHSVSTGLVDFKDLIVNKVDSDPTLGVIYSNKYAIKITLTQEITIEGFVVDITPTIREDINFYIRNTLAGSNLRSGLISGNVANSAHTTDQMLYVPFSYCGGVSPLTLAADISYYFILEPTISTSDNFFELHEASDIPNDVDIYEWYNNNYVIYHTDVNFYLISEEIAIIDDISVNSNGEASVLWNAFPHGNHSLLSWYHGAVIYSESYGSCDRNVIPTTEIIQVTLDPIVTQYKDNTPIIATLLDESLNPAVDKTVIYYVSSDGLTWNQIGIAISDSSGQATLSYTFDLLPNNYFLKAYVNDFSLDTNSLVINPEILVFENIDFIGRYRNNPGMPTFTKLDAFVLVKDDDNNPVPNLDLELWYKYEEEFEWIPHFFSTNISGFAVITHAIENLLVGNYLDTHYFTSASYEEGYQGISINGDTIVEKGFIDVIIQDYNVKWNDNLQLSAQVLTLDEGWEGITVEFSYFDNDHWHSLGVSNTNSSGYANLLWPQLPLTVGNYLLKAHAYESQYFEEQQEEANLLVDRQSLNLYIIKYGEIKGNGEEIDLEYTSTMYLTFYVTFEDGTPAANIVLKIVGRTINELFYNDLGFTTTNASGYALFNNYENVTIIGNQYLCVAQIDQNNKHESAALSFKINLIRCTPIVYFEDHLCEKGTYTELLVFVMNSEWLPLYNVHIQLIIEGIYYYGISDCYGFIRIEIAPEFSVGRYPIICRVIEDYRYNEVEVTANLVMSKGMPQFTLFNAYAIVDGYLTIRAKAIDLLGRPIAELTVLISFIGWSEYLTTNEGGYIEYTLLISGFEIGEYLSILTFNGNSDWFDTMSIATVLIYEEESQLELITTSISCTFGDEVYLEAQLSTLDGFPLENRLILFMIVYTNGTTIIIGQNTTDITGFVSLHVTILNKPGSYDLFAKYLGAIDYGPSYGLTSFVIQKSQVILLGNDFSAIFNSTTAFSVSIVNSWGQPVLNEKLYLYIWIDDNWLAIGCFLTDQNGIVIFTFAIVPFSLGMYILKIEFKGNDYYNSNYLNLDMTVVEPPPRIAPNIEISTDSTIFANYEEIQINIYVSNAAIGSTITVKVYVNGSFNGTLMVINGYGQYFWSTTKLGTYILSFFSVEDSVYFTASKTITIEITQNISPELIGYSYTDYIAEGELFSIEATFFDESGIDIVWFIANGTYYLLVFNGVSFNATIVGLKQGVYNTSLCAIDKQGYTGFYLLTPLNVFAKKTQMIKYHLNSNLLEIGQVLYFEVLVYAINSLSDVYLIINSIEHKMLIGYQINEHFSVWYISLDSLTIGNYNIEVKIIETTSYTVVEKINEVVEVIPIAPELRFYECFISKSGDSDFIYGNLTFNSYFKINTVEIWLDGQRIMVTKISNDLYSFSGYSPHSKSHTLKIQVSDVMGRMNIKEIVLGDIGTSPLLIVALVSAIIVVIAIVSTVTVFTVKQKRKVNNNSTVIDIDLPEIDEDNENHESLENNTPTISQLGSNNGATNISDKNRFDFFDDLNPTPSEAVISCDLQETDDESVDYIDTIEINPEPNFAQVKEYIAKVREDGLIPNDGSGNGDVKKTIEDLVTLNIEIDYRLLPDEEKMKKMAEIEELEESRVLNLKDIAEEIDQTFDEKKIGRKNKFKR